MLCTRLPLIHSGNTFLSLFSIKETESLGNSFPADPLIVVERRWQNIGGNTEILKMAHVDS